MNRTWRWLGLAGLLVLALALLRWAGLAPQVGAMAPDTALDAAPSGLAEETPTRDPYPWETVTPDLLFQGHVYKAGIGPLQPVAGARIAVTLCEPPAFATNAQADGSFGLYLPASYLEDCDQVIIEIRADGYARLRELGTVADLKAHPKRDFALAQLIGDLCLPIMSR